MISLTGTFLGVTAKFIPFLSKDISLLSSSAILPNGNIEVQVFRKAMHSKQVPGIRITSPCTAQKIFHNTLMHRANTIPSNHTLKMDEMKRVQESLQINGYPAKFIESCCTKI